MTLIMPNMVNYIRSECSSLEEYQELSRCIQEDIEKLVRKREGNRFFAAMCKGVDEMSKGLKSGELVINTDGLIVKAPKEVL